MVAVALVPHAGLLSTDFEYDGMFKERPGIRMKAEPGMEGPIPLPGTRNLPETVDIPILVSGDSWTYNSDTNTSGMCEGYVYNGTFTGERTYTVKAIGSINSNGTDHRCYIIDFNGDFELNANAQGGVVSITIETDVNGREYRSIADFSLIRTETIHNGTITVSRLFIEESWGYNLSINEVYKLPHEDYDFPVYPSGDESWSQDFIVYSSCSGDIGGDPLDENTIKNMKRTYSCTRFDPAVEAAGSFYGCHVIDVKESGTPLETRYYSGDVRNLVLTDTISKNLLLTSELSIDLKEGVIELSDEPTLGEYGTVMTLSAPFSVAPRTVIKVSGNIPGIDARQIDLFIPGENKTITVTIDNGHFETDVYIVGTADNSDSTDEIASHGIVALYNGNPPGLTVTTLIVADPDVRVFPGDIEHTFERPNETTALVGETVSLSITVNNPTLVDIHHLRASLLDNDEKIEMDDIVNITPKGHTIIGRKWIPSTPGDHRITVALDPFGALNETYEHNNNATLIITVVERPLPEIVDITPTERNLTIDESENITFSAGITELPGGSYTPSWLVKKGNETEFSQISEGNTSYRFISDHTGVFSSAYSPFVIKLSVLDAAAHVPQENTTTWKVNVVNVNRPPRIMSAAPDPATGVSMSENESRTFRIIGDDPDGEQPKIEWRLDGAGTNVTVSSYVYSTDHHSAGNHTLQVVLRDVENISVTTSVQWKIRVKNVNRPCRAVIETPLTNTQVEVKYVIKFSANGSSDPDIDPGNYSKLLTFRWTIDNETIMYGMNVTHKYSNTGNSTVSLNVSDPEGYWSIVFIELYVQPARDSDGDGWDDVEEENRGSDARDPKSTPSDRDGDGTRNDEDFYPDDPTRQRRRDDEEEKESISPMMGSILALIGIMIAAMIAMMFLLLFERKKKTRKEEDATAQRKEKGGLVGDLVEMEGYLEDIKENMGRIEGRLKQLQWDLEDGNVDRRHYDNLVSRYQNSQRNLRDEKKDVESRIHYLEIQLEREGKQKGKAKGRYGGAGSGDFDIPSYGEMDDGVELDKYKFSYEYEEPYDGDEIEPEMAPSAKGRYGAVHDEYGYRDKYSEFEDDDYEDEYDDDEDYFEEDDEYEDQEDYQDDY